MQHCLRALLARSAGPRGDVLYRTRSSRYGERRRTQRSTEAPRGVTALILALTAAAIQSVDSQGGRGAQWQPPINHAIPTSLSGQQCPLLNP